MMKMMKKVLVFNNSSLKQCHKFMKPQKLQYKGAVTNCTTSTFVYIIISIKFGELTCLYTKKQKRSSTWKMDKKTLTQRGIKIPNENIYFFTPTKQSYFKQLQKNGDVGKEGRKIRGIG